MYYFASFDPITKRVLSVLPEGYATVDALHKHARKLVGRRRWAHVVVVHVMADVTLDFACEIKVRD
jgi:hypothetical protein